MKIKLSVETKKYLSVKLTFERVIISILIVFSVISIVTIIAQKEETRKLKSEVKFQNSLLENINYSISELENENSKLQDKVKSLEYRLHDR